jgi:phosphomannomutase
LPNNGSTALIASVSGIRGVFNEGLDPVQAAAFAGRFGEQVGPSTVLVGTDTRRSGGALKRAVTGALLSQGCAVVDLGVVSTPAMFRESRVAGRPGVMVTASHNEPEFNGLKFLVEGVGLSGDRFSKLIGKKAKARRLRPQGDTRLAARPRYNEDLVKMFGRGSLSGLKVAMDLGGGAAIYHAPPILAALGCGTVSVNGTPGVFMRRIDPTADELSLLSRLVKEAECDFGLAFDCDGDRLVIVDHRGRKRSGDHMLALALAGLIGSDPEKKVVVSQDTTMAVDDVVGRAGGRVFRSKVGEANVVQAMKEEGADLGGEGSSGGLIKGSFNYCRDSMLAALVIARMVKAQGRKYLESVPSYHQARVAIRLPRQKAARAMKTLGADAMHPDTKDGVKLSLPDGSWVLVRQSGTEDVVRISAESKSERRAEELVRIYSRKLKGMMR